MTDHEFQDLLRRMRQARKDYFRSRTPAAGPQALFKAEARDLERRADEELRRRRTPDLFDMRGPIS